MAKLIKLAEALDLELCEFFIFPERSERMRAMDLLREADLNTMRRILLELTKK